MENLIEQNFNAEREIENLTLRIKELKGLIELNNFELKSYLITNGVLEESFNKFVVRLVESKIPKVEITNEKAIPKEFLRVKEVIEPDKIKIKEFLKENPECDFACFIFSEPRLEYKRI